METLNSNRVSSAKLVREFEKRFAERVVMRRGRIEKGLESPGQFNWEKSAIEIFEEVLGN
jgi:hypothetical protein